MYNRRPAEMPRYPVTHYDESDTKYMQHDGL